MILDDLRYIAKDLANAPRDMVSRIARVPGVKALVRQERCNGCSACVRKSYCRFGAIRVEDRKAYVDEERCRGCGRCTHLCKRDAFAMELRQPRIVKDALRRIDDGLTDLLN